MELPSFPKMPVLSSSWLEELAARDRSAPLLHRTLQDLWHSEQPREPWPVAPIYVATVLEEGDVEGETFFVNSATKFDCDQTAPEVVKFAKHIRQIPSHAKGCVVFLKTNGAFLSPTILNILGAVIDLSADLFLDHLRVPTLGQKVAPDPSPYGIPSRANHCSFGACTFKITTFTKYSHKRVPVAVILCSLSIQLTVGEDLLREEGFNALLGTRCMEENSYNPDSLDRRSIPVRTYEVMAEKLVIADRTSEAFDPIFFFLPILDLHAIHLNYMIDSVARRVELYSQDNSRSNYPDLVRFWWSTLRRMIDTTEASLKRYGRYIERSNKPTVYQDPLFLNALDHIADLLVQARQLELLIRDEIQLHTGQAQLAESVKSIEHAKRAIMEGRRMKLVTVLAFIFIPLNLSTSFFGMNLKQLNATGQDIWVFAVTAAGTYILSIVLWALGHLTTQWRDRWNQVELSQDWSPRTLGQRLSALWWLIKHGYSKKPGFEFSRLTLGLITNGRLGHLGCTRDDVDWNLSSLHALGIDPRDIQFSHPCEIYEHLLEKEEQHI